MFEVPDAKRVRREDLNSRSSRSTSPSSDVHTNADRAAALAQLQPSQHLTFEEIPNPLSADQRPDESNEAADQDTTEPTTYAFKLFAPTKPSSAATAAPTQPIARIDLSTSTPKGDGGLLNPRPKSSPFYTPTPSTLSNLHSTALSYSTLLDLAAQPRPGCHLPWRVTSLSLPPALRKKNASHLCTPLRSADPADEKQRKRCRKGKKTRIQLRTRFRAEEAKKKDAKERMEREREGNEEKERHVREKKKMANRRKQLKRREKARVAKGGEDGGEDVGGSEGGDGEAGGGELE